MKRGLLIVGLLFACVSLVDGWALAQVPIQVGRVEVEYINDAGTNLYTYGPNAFAGSGGIITYETGSNEVHADRISAGASGTVQSGQNLTLQSRSSLGPLHVKGGRVELEGSGSKPIVFMADGRELAYVDGAGVLHQGVKQPPAVIDVQCICDDDLPVRDLDSLQQWSAVCMCSSDAAAVRTTVQHVRAPPAPKIDNVRIDPAPEPKVWWPLPRSWGALVGAGVFVFIWAIIRVVMAVREPEPYVPKRRRKAKAA